ncbi:MAG: hypothetical protein HY556_10490 [Euryarchaeota archaeon]|nr:hypothetical protein [Euryarchaeota archaeon]
MAASIVALVAVILSAASPPEPFSLHALLGSLVLGAGLAYGILNDSARAKHVALAAVAVAIVFAPTSSSLLGTFTWVLATLVALEWSTRSLRESPLARMVPMLGLVALVVIGAATAWPRLVDARSPVFAVTVATLLLGLVIALSGLLEKPAEVEETA